MLALTVWFCLNQNSLTLAAYKKKSPAPAEVQAPSVEAPADVKAPEVVEVPAAEAPAVVEAPVAVTEEAPIEVAALGAVIAKAAINGTAEGSTLEGTAIFNQTPEGVGIEAEIINVSNPGKHGFHVHEKGSCDEGGNAAGGHYNPDQVQHGDLMQHGHTMAHAGDMGNITVDESGKALYSGFLPGVSLTEGKYNINGLAVILHEKEDDFGQPTGNAGGRIGCGIITLQ